MTLPEHLLQDYSSMALFLKAHPVSFARAKLSLSDVLTTQSLSSYKDGAIVRVPGLVLVRERSSTASGIVFITIEDETGGANLVVFQKLFNKYRKEILQSKLLMVERKLQIEGEVVHAIVQQCFNMSGLLQLSQTNSENLAILTSSKADEDGTDYQLKDRRTQKSIQAEFFPPGRNFK